MKKAVIYARVSSREQEKEGFSIPAQLKCLNEYAQKNGFQVVKEFTDNETAKQRGRTNFNEMLKFFKKNKDVKVVIVEKTDRLYRNLPDYGTLEDYNLEVHLVKEGDVLSKDSKSHQKFIHGIKVLMAKNYSDNLSEEIRKGLTEKAEQGYLPMKPPHGYKRVDNKLVQIDPDTAPFVIRAFNLYAKGDKSLETVSQQLRDEGFIFKSYKPKIAKTYLEKMLKNVFYKGLVLYRGKIYQGVHEPIIDELLFEKAQGAFRKDGKPLSKKEHGFMFSNIMTCPDCGCSIIAEIKKAKYIYYHCSWGKGKKNCSNKEYVRQETLEEQFEEVVKKISMDDEQKNWIKTALKTTLHEEQEYYKERIESLNRQAQQLRERIDKIYLDKLDGNIDEEFWRIKHNEWTAQLVRIKSILNSHDETHDKFLKTGNEILELATVKRQLV